MRQIVTTAAAVLAVLGSGVAVQAMPLGRVGGPALTPTLIAEGCGPGFHRGPEGRCRPNEMMAPRRACPRGTHLGPEGRECRPNL